MSLVHLHLHGHTLYVRFDRTCSIVFHVRSCVAMEQSATKRLGSCSSLPVGMGSGKTEGRHRAILK